MPRTQYYTATSLDGFIADRNHSLDWLFSVDRDGADGFPEFFANVGAFAMGSTTYRWILEHENALEQPEKWRAWYGDTPAWVFTTRDLTAVPGADVRFVRGGVRPVHEAMTAVAGERNIWLVGGGELVGEFADEGLLDELIVGVTPVTLGMGAPLLPRRLTTERLRLTGVERQGQMVQLSYAVGPAASSAE